MLSKKLLSMFSRSSRYREVDWLVVLGLRPFETVFQSISGRLPKRGRKRKERIDESKNVQTTPTRTYCKCSNPDCRTPRHWKFTQHHRTTRPPPPPPPPPPPRSKTESFNCIRFNNMVLLVVLPLINTYNISPTKKVLENNDNRRLPSSYWC